jgi:hypothetical protein
LLSRFNTGPVDLSLILAIFAISIISRIITRIFLMF